MSISFKKTLGYCITNPRVYGIDNLRDAIRECNEVLGGECGKIGPNVQEHMQEQKAKFLAEIKRRRDLPLNKMY